MEYDDKCQVGDYNDMLSQAHKLALSSTSRAGATFRRKADLESFFTIQHEYLNFLRTGFSTVLKLLALKRSQSNQIKYFNL